MKEQCEILLHLVFKHTSRTSLYIEREHMARPGEWTVASGICAARLRNRARRQRSHRATPILSMASTALEQSTCKGLDRVQSLVPCRQDIKHIVICIDTFQLLKKVRISKLKGTGVILILQLIHTPLNFRLKG